MDFSLVSKEVLAFCRSISQAEASRLVFRKPVFEGISNAWLAEQAGLQRLAGRKLPEWEKEELIFPDRQALEQCTSALIAEWKKKLVPAGISVLADASAGLGVDAFYLSEKAENLLLFETSQHRCKALEYNARVLRNKKTEVRFGSLSDAELTALLAHGSSFLLYADPDRRSETGDRKFDWRNCLPDIRGFHRLMAGSASGLLVKFSPLDDAEEIAGELPGLHSVYLLSVHNEVKEVLLYWQFASVPVLPEFYAIDLRRTGEMQQVRIPAELEGRPGRGEIRTGRFILDPWASLRKGRFAACLAEERGWEQLSAKGRLFISDEAPSGFPGRVFRLEAAYDSPSSFRKAFAGNSCHVVCRDYPAPAAELLKKLKLREEGDDYLFCFSDEAGRRRVLHTRRC